MTKAFDNIQTLNAVTLGTGAVPKIRRVGTAAESQATALLVASGHTGTSGNFGVRINHTQTTNQQTSGYGIGLGVVCDYNLTNGGQGLAQWLVAASPYSASQNFGVFGMELNPINRAGDEGYGKTRSAFARWMGGIQSVPESRDLVGGTTQQCYDVLFGFATAASVTNTTSGTKARTYNGLLIEEDSISPGGRGALFSGKASATNQPAYAVEIDKYWQAGIYTVDGTFTNNNAILLGNNHRVRFGSGSFPGYVYGDATSGTISFGLDTGDSIRIYRATSNAVVNRIEFAGNQTGSNPVIRTDGDDANISLNLNTKGASSSVFLRPNSLTSVRVDSVASQVNSFQLFGGAAGQGVTVNALGTDTNINIIFSPKGTGSVVVTGLVARDYADDTAAAAGGVSIGGLYHNAGAVRVRRT